MMVVIHGACIADVTQSSEAADFQKFWVKFRAAVVTDNKSAILAMTRFPFRTRGEVDSDPEISRDSGWFRKNIEKLMRQDPGLREEPETMRSLIKRTKVVDVSAQGTNRQVRVGTFVFEQSNEGKWLFTLAYISP